MHLKAMKKHDMDQAETMVPEGQVKMLVVQSETTYQCDKCSYVTCKERAFRDLPHVCTHCDAPFSSDIALRNHCKRSHSLQVSFSCKQCDFTCARDGLLKAHQLSKHPRVKCTTCQKSFETEKSLEIHQRAHHVHRCQSCPFSSKTKQLLADHLLSKHEEGSPEKKPYACDQCDYRTNRADALRAHRDTQHCDARSYVCEKCGKAFKTSFILKTHQRKHIAGRPYTCGVCQKAFRWPWTKGVQMLS
uniref:Zinc finger protein 142 n=1 Tax=Oryzias latipes TaxID=8090 RepID=A0A3P9J095_ORYLA